MFNMARRARANSSSNLAGSINAGLPFTRWIVFLAMVLWIRMFLVSQTSCRHTARDTVASDWARANGVSQSPARMAFRVSFAAALIIVLCANQRA